MAQDDNMEFSSTWSIDQILSGLPILVDVPANTDTLLYTTSDSVNPPMFDIQFKPSGSTLWYQTGANSTDNTLGGLFYCSAWVAGTSIKCRSEVAGTARIYVWSGSFNV